MQVQVIRGEGYIGAVDMVMMSDIKKLLVANRGKMAVRILHTASELGILAVAMLSEDEAQSVHKGN